MYTNSGFFAFCDAVEVRLLELLLVLGLVLSSYLVCLLFPSYSLIQECP